MSTMLRGYGCSNWTYNGQCQLSVSWLEEPFLKIPPESSWSSCSFLQTQKLFRSCFWLVAERANSEVNCFYFSHLFVGESFWKHVAGREDTQKRVHNLALGDRGKLRRERVITSSWTCCPHPEAMWQWEDLSARSRQTPGAWPEGREQRRVWGQPGFIGQYRVPWRTLLTFYFWMQGRQLVT